MNLPRPSRWRGRTSTASGDSDSPDRLALGPAGCHRLAGCSSWLPLRLTPPAARFSGARHHRHPHREPRGHDITIAHTEKLGGSTSRPLAPRTSGAQHHHHPHRETRGLDIAVALTAKLEGSTSSLPSLPLLMSAPQAGRRHKDSPRDPEANSRKLAEDTRPPVQET